MQAWASASAAVSMLWRVRPPAGGCDDPGLQRCTVPITTAAAPRTAAPSAAMSPTAASAGCRHPERVNPSGPNFLGDIRYLSPFVRTGC